MVEGILSGLQEAFTGLNILMVIVGCFAGTFIGMLPGLGPISAIALMIPITYGFPPATALILMAGVYYGAVFGGSTSSILINAPGVSSTVATTFDGYPMSQKGYAGRALAIAAYCSFTGGTVGAVFLLIAAPLLAQLALTFQSSDYFALMLMGLTAISAFTSKETVFKSILMAVFGIMLSTIGTDLASGVQRFTFGSIHLVDGLSFIMIVMAIFALSESLLGILRSDNSAKDAADAISTQKISSLRLGKGTLKKLIPTMLRSSVLGFFVGVLPGAGATIASFLAYGVEQNLASPEDKKEFGKGSPIGLAAPETANNAASSGSFVPLLTLGIPGSGTTAVILGALISYGIQPGPRLFVEQPAIFWSVIVSMYIGNLILLVLNLPLIPFISRLLMIKKEILVPLILFFSLIGVYLVSFNNVDIFFMVGLAILAVFLNFASFPLPPLILGFILGGPLEENLRRALIINKGSFSFLWERPISLTLFILTLFFLFLPFIRRLIAFLRQRVKN